MERRAKQMLVAGLVMALSLGAAVADIGLAVEWYGAQAGGLPASAGGGFANPTYHQLLWSAAAPTAGDLAPGVYDSTDAAGTAYSVPWGTEYLLDSGQGSFGIYNPGATSQGFYSDSLVPGSITAGYVYSRIFSAVGALDQANTWFFQSANVETPALPIWDTADPENQNLLEHISTSKSSGTFTYDQQLVPEPGTIALFALGLMTVGLRRFRRS